MASEHPAGFVGYDAAGRFVHMCHCGKWGAFGYGAHFTNKGRDQLGKWFCGDHRPEGPVPISVTLSEVWLQKAIEAGKARNAHARQNEWTPYYGTRPENTEARDIVGCIAEVAVAKHFRRPWKPAVGEASGIDVGGVIEVRGRPIPGPGPDLGIRPNDKDELPYVLVHVHADNTIRLIGWLYGHEGKNKPERWNEKCGIWFNPPPYRPISELVEKLR